MFPLGHKFIRKDQLTKMLVPLQSSIILRKNMVDSQFLQLNASFQSDHYHKTPYSKNGWKYTRPYHSLKFQEIFLWSIRAKRNHPDPINTNPMNILIIWYTCWEKNVWLVDLPVPESSSGLNLLLPWAVFRVLQCFAFIWRPFQEKYCQFQYFIIRVEATKWEKLHFYCSYSLIVQLASISKRWAVHARKNWEELGNPSKTT